MALIDFHILIQSLVYFLTGVCGLIVVTTFAINKTEYSFSHPILPPKSNFEGDCILYADFTSEGSGRSLKVWMHASAASKCDFPIYFSAFGLLVYGVLMGTYYMHAVARSRQDPNKGSDMWVMPFLFLNSVLAFISLVMACILTVGFSSFCNGLLDFYPSSVKCSNFENTDWTRQYSSTRYNVGPFVTLMDTSITGAWLGFVLLLIQTALCILRFRRNQSRGQQPSQQNPPKK